MDKEMTKEIAKQDDVHDPFLALVEKIASNPDIDADKIEKFLIMQERILDRNAKGEFYAAMTRVQAKLPTVYQASYNPQTKSKYAKYEDIAAEIKPIYTAEGFSVSFSEGETAKPEHIRIDGVLRHSSGHSETAYADIPIDNAGIKGTVNKTGPHATASSFTYGRRYLVCLMFDVSTGDDADGNQPEDNSTLSDEQIANIETLLSEIGAEQAAFLNWAKADNISNILARQYDKCIRRLEDKR